MEREKVRNREHVLVEFSIMKVGRSRYAGTTVVRAIG